MLLTIVYYYTIDNTVCPYCIIYDYTYYNIVENTICNWKVELLATDELSKLHTCDYNNHAVSKAGLLAAVSLYPWTYSHLVTTIPCMACAVQYSPGQNMFLQHRPGFNKRKNKTTLILCHWNYYTGILSYSDTRHLGVSYTPKYMSRSCTAA